MTKLSNADKAYLDWQKDQSGAETLKLGQHEAFIHIRRDASVEFYVDLSQSILAPELLALGLRWALENEEWKHNLMKKAQQKLVSIMEEEGVAFTTTPSDTHEKTS